MRLIYTAISSQKEAFNTDEKKEALHKAILKLSGREQEILSMRYGKQYTMKAIARILGVSTTTVYADHSRAIYHLRREFTPEYFKEMEDIISRTAEKINSFYKSK